MPLNMAQKSLNDAPLKIDDKNVNPGDVFDLQVLNAFLELIGDDSEVVLKKHCEVAEKYLENLKESLAKKDLKAVADAAHPLKSSSRQIGAKEMAALAASIEQMGCSISPDYQKLEEMISQAKQCQARVEKAIKLLFS